MNLLCTSAGLSQDYEFTTFLSYCKSQHHLIEQMRIQEIGRYLRFSIAPQFALIDAIVCWANEMSMGFSFSGSPKFGYLDAPLHRALALAAEVRALPETSVMHDGRKWRSIPFIIFCGPLDPYMRETMETRTHAKIYSSVGSHPAAALCEVSEAVSDYTDRILDEYRNFGMLVRFEKGHAQIRPALRRKNAKVESDYYHSGFDRRRSSGWVTVKRDSQGLQHDVELFQQLLDRNATETEMHRFFEEHPLFLMQARMGNPISHQPRFDNPFGQTADFSLLPILGSEDSNIEMLELKGPGEKAITRGLHAGFSAKVKSAIDQVRDYDRYFSDPANLKRIVKGLGFLPQKRNLAVLIGRAPKSEEQKSLWKRRQEEVNIEVISYDEILAPQLNQLQSSDVYLDSVVGELRRESTLDRLQELSDDFDF